MKELAFILTPLPFTSAYSILLSTTWGVSVELEITLTPASESISLSALSAVFGSKQDSGTLALSRNSRKHWA